MNPEKLNYLIEETLSSMDAAERATPAPYLLTRINARMQQDAPGFWERASFWISRSPLAFSIVAILIVANLFIYISKTPEQTAQGERSNASLQGTADIYSGNTSTAFFDLENLQP